MCGCASLPASDASAMKDLCFMRSCSRSASLSNRNTLTATSRSANGSRARYTLLVAPAPISRSSGYLPMCSWSSNFMSRGSLLRERRDLLQELRLLVRLAEERVHAELGGARAMLGRGARRNDDDRDVHGARIAAHVAREVKAVHARHLDVDQHDRRQLALELLQRIDAVLGGQHAVALALEQAAGDLAHGKGVVHHHDERRSARRLAGELRRHGALH